MAQTPAEWNAKREQLVERKISIDLYAAQHYSRIFQIKSQYLNSKADGQGQFVYQATDDLFSEKRIIIGKLKNTGGDTWELNIEAVEQPFDELGIPLIKSYNFWPSTIKYVKKDEDWNNIIFTDYNAELYKDGTKTPGAAIFDIDGTIFEREEKIVPITTASPVATPDAIVNNTVESPTITVIGKNVTDIRRNHICDLPNFMRYYIAKASLSIRKLINSVRQTVENLAKSESSSPFITRIKNIVRQIKTFIKKVKNILKWIKDTIKEIIDYIVYVRDMIAWILSLPGELLKMFITCLSELKNSFVEALTFEADDIKALKALMSDKETSVSTAAADIERVAATPTPDNKPIQLTTSVV